MPLSPDIRNLLRFEDEADAGDEYSFGPLPGDAGRAGRTVRALGANDTGTQLRYVLAAPAALDDPTPTETPIVVELSEEPTTGETCITVKLDNRAQDHRLRMLVDTGARFDRSFAGAHFHIAERTRVVAATPEDDAERYNAGRPGELDYATQFSQDFVLVRGIDAMQSTSSTVASPPSTLVAHRGLHEYELVEREGRTWIAITLLRAVGVLSREGGRIRRIQAGPSVPTPEAQCRGEHRFDLSITRLPADVPPHHAAMLGGAFAHPLLVRQIDLHPYLAEPTRRPLEHSLLRIEPETVAISACRACDDGAIVVRVFNRSPSACDAVVVLAADWERVARCDLEERPVEWLEAGAEGVRFPLRAWGIETLRFELSEEGR